MEELVWIRDKYAESPDSICIVGLGSVTAVGYTAAMTAASVRANLSRFRETYMIDRAGEPMRLSLARFVPDAIRGVERLSALAELAIDEALSPLLPSGRSREVLSSLALQVATAEPRPGLDSKVTQLLLDKIAHHTAIPLYENRCALLPDGHAGGLMAIEKGVAAIRNGKTSFVLAGGVESYYNPDTLEWLDENRRLHSDVNRDGFVPGEGAAFCLLTTAELARRFLLSPKAWIVSTASAEEPNPLISDGICVAKGLTSVLQAVLSVPVPGRSVADWTICDMNGESFRSTEWIYAYLRTGVKHRDPLELWHPADCYGDIGAASGPVLAGIAIAAWQRQYARGVRSLIWASSDGVARSALLLASANPN